MNAHVTALCMATAMGWVMTFCTADSTVGQVRSGDGLVAVLDVAQVFKKDDRFCSQMEQLRKEAAEWMARQSETENKVSAAKARLELMEKEAKIYSDTYDRVRKTVASIAKDNGISLVIRASAAAELDGESEGVLGREKSVKGEGKAASYQEVIKRLNSTVIYQDHLDLTTMVIHELNESNHDEGGRCESCGQKIHATRR